MPEYGSENLVRKLESEVRAKVERAASHRLNHEEYLQWKANYEKQMTELHDPATFDRDDYNRACASARKNPRNVLFNNPHEFIVLKKIFYDRDFNQRFKHEVEHFNAARELGFINPAIGLFFFLDEHGLKWFNIFA